MPNINRDGAELALVVHEMRWWPALVSTVCATLASNAAFADDVADGDHSPQPRPVYLGVQLGGPSVFEAVLRLRIAGPVLFEVGGLAFAGGGFVGNVSQGIVVELEAPSHRLPYLAFGTAAAGGCGEGEAGLGCGGIVYGYARVGLQWQSSTKRGRTELVTLDGGAWLGGTNNDDRGFRPFLIPMVGVGLYWGRER